MRVPPMTRQYGQQNGAQNVRLARCVGTLIGHRAFLHPSVPQACRLQKFDEKCQLPERRYRRRLIRSEEHTSELQSPCNLVCRLLLEKKKKNNNKTTRPQVDVARATYQGKHQRA